jgi:hypothetical protein
VKLVYIAGPFSARTREGVELNIARAVALGVEVARLGAMPVCPHANTSHPEYERVQPYSFWIEGTMLLLRKCDAVMLVPGWENSKGACCEYDDAFQRNVPIFDALGDLDRWLMATSTAEVPIAPHLREAP